MYNRLTVKWAHFMWLLTNVCAWGPPYNEVLEYFCCLRKSWAASSITSPAPSPLPSLPPPRHPQEARGSPWSACRHWRLDSPFPAFPGDGVRQHTLLCLLLSSALCLEMMRLVAFLSSFPLLLSHHPYACLGSTNICSSVRWWWTFGLSYFL